LSTIIYPHYDLPLVQAEASRLISIDLKVAVLPPVGGYPAKGPSLTHWPQAALEGWCAPEEIPYGCNIGVLTGTPFVRNGATYYVADVDIDDKNAIDIFAKILPPTMVWGRPGKPRSHYLYLTDKQIVTEPGAERNGIVEVFGICKNGNYAHQSVVPPSVWHKNGTFELLRYEPDSFSEPAIISAEMLAGLRQQP
jgi:hypothetical protein